MATVGRKQVAAGQTISSVDWGNPVWDQSVQCFASTADRDTQYPTPHVGSLAFTEADGLWWGYKSGAWQQLSSLDIVSLNRSLGNTLGTFNPAKPIRTMSGWATTTTSSVGQFMIAMPAGCTCIMSCAVTPLFLSASGETVSLMHLRLDSSTLNAGGGVSVQARNPNTSAALNAVNVSYTYVMTYQI